MGTKQLKPGATVKINFPEVHRELYPHYCARWQGRFGIIVESPANIVNRGYTSVYVGGETLCLERDHVEQLTY
jgi:hypothetical protein